MGHNDHVDFELYHAVQVAIEEGHLDHEVNKDALGVARQLISQGMDSLSPKQRALYRAVIEPALARTDDDLTIRAAITSAPD